ncbi:MAG: hypothetical protein JXQ73_09515 [Phycisphaerae bacterium]|nr:hypothetical protein [Phycisphaerae bacterium]
MPRSQRPADPATRYNKLSALRTAETFVIAFVAALVFRGFVAEAMVVPTGSMAPNLEGFHQTQTCSVCGFEYDYGHYLMQDESVRPPRDLTCPNCGYGGDRPTHDAPYRGDQIGVIKAVFDVGRLFPSIDPHGPRQWWHAFKPCRWDVVVFKDPNDGTTNFVKRLIGLPGEVLEIIDGDIYTARATDLEATPEGRSVLNKLEKHAAAYDELAPKERRVFDRALKIQRKTDRAQSVLWLHGYDHDYLPVRKPELARWQPALTDSRWRTDERVLRFRASQDHEPLQEIVFLRRGPETQGDQADACHVPIEDVYGYNGSTYSVGGSTPIPVSDLRLRCLLTPGQGNGRLTLSLSKRDDRFTATFASSGEVSLTRSSVSEPNHHPTVLGTAQAKPLVPGQPVQVALSNVDYRVGVWIGDHKIIETNDDQYPARVSAGSASLAAYARKLSLDSDEAAPRIRIGAAGMSLDLAHVRIERDVYYRSLTGSRRSDAGWGTQGRPIYLRNQPERGVQEYFCLGDNSPLSKDGRLWDTIGPHLTPKLANGTYQYGTVPADQMMGRAFCVYWPGAMPLFGGRLRIVPNVGDVRMIR